MVTPRPWDTGSTGRPGTFNQRKSSDTFPVTAKSTNHKSRYLHCTARVRTRQKKKNRCKKKVTTIDKNCTAVSHDRLKEPNSSFHLR